MPEEYHKMLKYNEGVKSMRVRFIIYADLECLLEEINTSHHNPEKSSTTKIDKHTPSGYSDLGLNKSFSYNFYPYNNQAYFLFYQMINVYKNMQQK